MTLICPVCKSRNITLYMGGQLGKYKCKECRYIGSFVIEIDNIKPVRVLIIGAGFAGLQTAFSLKRIMRNKVSITLIDKNQFHLFTPGLIKYLTNKLTKKNIAINLAPLLKNKGIIFLQGEVDKIKPRKKEVDVGKKKVTYDYLVISVGSETNNNEIKGVDKYAYKFRTLEDAYILKQKIKKLICSKKAFNIAVIGGGLTGVQLASSLRDYFDLSQTHTVNISLLNAGRRLLTELPEKVSKRVKNHFFRKKIKILFNSRVIKLEKNKIHLISKQIMRTDLIIWVAGIIAPKELEKFGLDYCSKGIYINKYFQTINPFIFAIGDCASFKDKNLEKYSVKRAQNAHEQGKLVARNIANNILKKKMKAWNHKKIPTIVLLNSGSIFHYKKFVIQNRFVSVLDWLIRLRHITSYSSWLNLLKYLTGWKNEVHK